MVRVFTKPGKIFRFFYGERFHPPLKKIAKSFIDHENFSWEREDPNHKKFSNFFQVRVETLTMKNLKNFLIACVDLSYRL